jgi:hypothetical protein
MMKIHDIKPLNPFAFVTLLYGNQPFFVEALVLAMSLRRLSCQADTIIMIGDGVSNGVIRLIRKSKLFTHMVQVPALSVHDSHVGTLNRWNKLIFNKCYVWALVQYKKVAFVDADIIIHNHNEFISLFHEFLHSSVPAACFMGKFMNTHQKLLTFPHSCPDKSKISAGLMVITPSQRVFTKMVKQLETPSTFEGQFFTNHEEVFLSDFFSTWASIHIRFSYPPLWLMTFQMAKPLLAPITVDQVVATHFVGYKPHLYLLKEEYIEKDKATYHERTNKNGNEIFCKSQMKWLKMARKIDNRVYKKYGKHLTDFGDWVTPIDYKVTH